MFYPDSQLHFYILLKHRPVLEKKKLKMMLWKRNQFPNQWFLLSPRRLRLVCHQVFFSHVSWASGLSVATWGEVNKTSLHTCMEPKIVFPANIYWISALTPCVWRERTNTSELLCWSQSIVHMVRDLHVATKATISSLGPLCHHWPPHSVPAIKITCSAIPIALHTDRLHHFPASLSLFSQSL